MPGSIRTCAAPSARMIFRPGPSPSLEASSEGPARRLHEHGNHRVTTNGELMGDPSPLAEITVVAKIDGPLTKRISLVENGHLVSDGSACTMSRGGARRWRGDVHEFAALLEQLGSR